MTKIALAVLLLCSASLASARDVVFQKCDVVDSRGKKIKARLVFSGEKKAMLVELADRPIADIPYSSIDKLSYEYSKHHRIRTGATVMIFSLGAGGVVMLTKSRSHWFYVDYHESEGKEAKSLTLRMDKKEYKDILDAANEETGKQVEMLNDTGGGRKKKKKGGAPAAPVAPEPTA